MARPERSYAETIFNNELDRMIVPVPKRQMIERDNIIIQNAVFDRILDVKKANDTGFRPKFEGRPRLEGGALRTRCSDEQTVEWLRDTVPQLEAPWERHQLAVKKLSEMPRHLQAGIALPKHVGHGDVDRAWMALEYCNLEHKLGTWWLQRAVQREETIFLAVSIPEDVIPDLMSRGRKLSYGMGSVYVRFFLPDRTMSDTPPPRNTYDGAEH